MLLMKEDDPYFNPSVKKQEKLFVEKEIDYDTKYEWNNMPEFINENNDAHRKIIVSFQDEKSVKKFADLLDQRITDKTKSLWFPPKEKSNKISMWVDNEEN